MSDQKKWFKVWASILNDDGFNNMRLEDIGRWVRLGALICQQGTNGKLQITPPAILPLMWFRCDDIVSLKVSLSVLPNVIIEEGLSDNGSFFVIMKNWRKYQVDSTVYDRLKRLRRKRRGEEKRKEEMQERPFLSKKEDPKWM